MSRVDAQIKLRLPEALRDRIKAYADAHKRSMNAEIVRILEKEFPEALDMTGQIEKLVEMLEFLRDGKANDQNVGTMAAIIQETIEGIVTGRVRGVDETARSYIETEWQRYQEDLLKNNDFNTSLDEEEVRSLYHSGTTAKYVWPDGEIGPKEQKRERGAGAPKDYDDPDFPD
ncbi:Arc family DNA-binding protein [Falsochrobactrum ovis]|uniref:Arc-like DNA binding dprotein n=1 Tax=Falsochrobactrum ovis TaxID=1293442 RepID=A0A364JVS4_9HYPH|nr:Arc family DNA-binding protein [Falsochrobactrum ovis]RAK29039.1 Arc-like DNA binding dprotein [Falsochrobactrum ovis]